MSKVLRTFITIADIDCESFGGIMDEQYDEELSKCSTKELGEIKTVLDRCSKEIQERILEKHLEDTYNKGFEDGKASTIESLEEGLN